MPNWCKGSLKVRGTKASLKTFILQVIEIIDGKIVKDEELHFKDYQWDCICPKLGG